MPPHRQPTISTHVLDNERGQPASGVRVTLERRDGRGFVPLGDAVTDADGRIASLLTGDLLAGVYRITFDAAGYFADRGGERPFVRAVSIEFDVIDAARHYHVPLLLTRFACTSYRGS
jgi:5-hydroxyisourate hydrolase